MLVRFVRLNGGGMGSVSLQERSGRWCVVLSVCSEDEEHEEVLAECETEDDGIRELFRQTAVA